jgi:PilZ domain
VSDGDRDAYGVEIADRRSGDQRRDAFRTAMNMPVYVDEPMERYCELVDVSVLGLRLDRELPCTPGVTVFFRLVIPSYGATAKPAELELAAEVVRVEDGFTGLRFVKLELSESRAVRELVHDHQRLLLLAARPGAVDRRRSWLQR